MMYNALFVMWTYGSGLEKTPRLHCAHNKDALNITVLKGKYILHFSKHFKESLNFDYIGGIV